MTESKNIYGQTTGKSEGLDALNLLREGYNKIHEKDGIETPEAKAERFAEHNAKLVAEGIASPLVLLSAGYGQVDSEAVRLNREFKKKKRTETIVLEIENQKKRMGL